MKAGYRKARRELFLMVLTRVSFVVQRALGRLRTGQSFAVEFDLSAFLHAGENRLAVMVRAGVTAVIWKIRICGG